MRKHGVCVVAVAMVLAVLALCDSAWAHGGQFQSPPMPPGKFRRRPHAPPGSGQPGAPAGLTSDVGGLEVTHPDAVPPAAWWRRHRLLYLSLGRRGPPLAARTLRDGEAPPDDVVAPYREQLVPLLIQALSDAEVDVRSSAVVALGKSGDARALAALRLALADDPSDEVRQAALLGLGMLRDETDLPLLAATLEDDAETDLTRSFAAFGLGLLGGPDAAAVLRRTIGGRAAPGRRAVHADIRGAAVLALGETRDPSAIEALRAVLRERSLGDELTGLVAGALARTGHRDSFGWLANQLDRGCPDDTRRGAAAGLAHGLGAADKAEIQRLVSSGLHDEDPTVRMLALLTLGNLRDDGVGRRLLSMLDAVDRSQRPSLQLALGLSGAPEAGRYLRKELLNVSGDPGTLPIALGLQGDPENARVLHTWLQRERRSGRAAAMLALGMLGQPESVAVVAKELDGTPKAALPEEVLLAALLLDVPGTRARVEAQLAGGDTIRGRAGAALVLGESRTYASVDALLAAYGNAKEQAIVRAVAVVALGYLLDASPHPRHLEYGFHRDLGADLPALNELLGIL